jgi:cyclic beta-1,2-glucan synthetase
MTYRRGKTTYQIEVSNPQHCEQGVAAVELNGRKLEDDWIQLAEDGQTHRVVVRMAPSVSAPARTDPVHA